MYTVVLSHIHVHEAYCNVYVCVCVCVRACVRLYQMCRVVTRSFGKRRKILRQSLKGNYSIRGTPLTHSLTHSLTHTTELIIQDGLVLPDKWLLRRPQELAPAEFLELTADLYGTHSGDEYSGRVSECGSGSVPQNIWRT
jgi:hypothetical protein